MPDQDKNTKISEVQVLTTKRSYVRQGITKICGTIMDENVQLTTKDLSSYSIKVKHLQEQIRVLDESILIALITIVALQNRNYRNRGTLKSRKKIS